MRSGDAGIDRFPVRRCHRQYGTGKVRVPDLPIGKVTVTVNEAVPTQYVVHDTSSEKSIRSTVPHSRQCCRESVNARKAQLNGRAKTPENKGARGRGGGEGRKASGLHLCLYSAIATASVWHKVAGETQRRRAKRPFLPIVDQKTSYACTRTVRGAWKPPSKKKKKSSLGKA